MDDCIDFPLNEPSAPTLWTRRQGTLHQLDTALHTLYIAHGWILLQPHEAAERIDEAIILIEGMLPDLRTQLLGTQRDSDGRA